MYGSSFCTLEIRQEEPVGFLGIEWTSAFKGFNDKYMVLTLLVNNVSCNNHNH